MKSLLSSQGSQGKFSQADKVNIRQPGTWGKEEQKKELEILPHAFTTASPSQVEEVADYFPKTNKKLTQGCRGFQLSINRLEFSLC